MLKTASSIPFITGSFTPVVSQGFDAPTYTTQRGTYTKIGNLVHFDLYIYMGAALTRNGDAVGINGFPYAIATGNLGGCTWSYASGVVSSGPLPVFYMSGTGGLFYNTAGGAFAGTSLASAQPEIAISGTYITS